MSDEHKRPRLAFWFAVVVFTVLPAYRIDLVGWFIDSLIEGFGAWAWVAILVIWLCFMLGIAAFILLRKRDVKNDFRQKKPGVAFWATVALRV